MNRPSYIMNRIATVNVVSNCDGSIFINAYPSTAEGRADALAQFHAMVLESENEPTGMDDEGVPGPATAEQIAAEYPSIQSANYSHGDTYDVVIVESSI